MDQKGEIKSGLFIIACFLLAIGTYILYLHIKPATPYGTWITTEGLVMVIKPDGTGSLQSNRIKWIKSRQTETLGEYKVWDAQEQEPERNVLGYFSLSGEVLVLDHGDLGQITFLKK